VWWKMLRGLTTRNYPLVTRSFAEAYGIEKSAISQRFIQASREKLKTLMERPLGELKLCAIVLDGTPFKGRQMIAAIGVAHNGKKTVLGLREGAREEHDGRARVAGGPGAPRAGFFRSAAVRLGWREGSVGGGEATCGGSCRGATLPGP